jgi:hypothetical protein
MRRQKIKPLKSTKKKNKKYKGKAFSLSPSAKNLSIKRSKLRKKTFSPYPYIMIISYYRTNVFFTVADIEGHTQA